MDTNKIILCIENVADIYFQKTTFEDLYAIIEDELEAINDFISFQKKVLDCQFLVLIGDTRGRQNESIEEIFLDINFKSQLLDAADIFKGYCFKNYTARYHEELKKHWTVIRKNIKQFERIGYSDVETCEYLYHYLLSCPPTYKITADLSFNGKHCLDGKSHTYTKALLVDMGEYGTHVLEFFDNLFKDTYYFKDICGNAEQFRTDITNHRRIKEMFKAIISNRSAQYYKLPLFMILHYLRKYDKLRLAFSYRQLKKFVTNYYVYSFLFNNSKSKKNKSAIDHTIFDKLAQISTVSPDTVISGIMDSVKGLRCNYLEEYDQFTSFGAEKTYAFYSLIDCYSAANNFLFLLYAFPEYNIEHLIMHDNKLLNVTWIEENNTFTFSLKELLGKASEKTYYANIYKKLSANYIILPTELNSSLEHDDIVQKTYKIKTYYAVPGRNLPKHINIFLTHIDGLKEFSGLSALKGQRKSPDEIKLAYKIFAEAYFSEESQSTLYKNLKQSFKDTFKNLA